MGDERRWRRRPDTLWRRSLDQVFLLHPDADDDPVVMTGSGVGVWEMLDQPVTLHELASELADRYRADVVIVERDLAVLLADLESQSFVECV